MIIRGHRVIALGASESNVNLATKAGNPSESCNVLVRNTAAKTGTGGTPAIRTGSTWKRGSTIHFVNQSSATGNVGSTGSNATPGTPGAGGAGGPGYNFGSGPAQPGSPGSPGGSASPAGNGGPGGPAFTADAVTGVRIVVDNGPGSMVGGTGGPGGSGAPGGSGGGGGGGGGEWEWT